MIVGNQRRPCVDLSDVHSISSDAGACSIAGSTRTRLGRPTAVVLALVFAASVLVGCGGDEAPDLSPLAAEGRSLATERGCASCHGADGGGGVGPAWRGLHGSEVQLEDGTTLIADAEYLTTSITDPDAQIVEGYTVRMPANDLDAGEVEAIVAYIQELP